MSFILYNEDCLNALKRMEDNSIDSVVTDPPYGLSFMGKKWDYDVPSEAIWAECLRVLKPGGHLLAFAGTRTQHRMAVRIEDAGFEIRDMIAWVYGSGFPKSHNGEWGGTALKPALEPITMARKPLTGTVASNVLEWGTGAINVDGCRVEGGTRPLVTSDRRLENNTYAAGPGGSKCEGITAAGRWPANLIHSGEEEVVSLFPSDKQGSAARFFYCAKASKRDRDEGLEGFETAKTNDGRKVDADNAYQRGATLRANIHPTVKPTDLMRYLCRLVTPPGGVVLDPFMGSGSTGKAAMLEGFTFIGCEMSAEYIEIAKARIEHALQQYHNGNIEVDQPQPDLFKDAA